MTNTRSNLVSSCTLKYTTLPDLVQICLIVSLADSVLSDKPLSDVMEKFCGILRAKSPSGSYSFPVSSRVTSVSVETRAARAFSCFLNCSLLDTIDKELSTDDTGRI